MLLTQLEAWSIEVQKFPKQIATSIAQRKFPFIGIEKTSESDQIYPNF